MSSPHLSKTVRWFLVKYSLSTLTSLNYPMATTSTTIPTTAPFLSPQMNCLICGVQGGRLCPVNIDILCELLRLSSLALPASLAGSQAQYRIPVCPPCFEHVHRFTILLTQLRTLVEEMDRIRHSVAMSIHISGGRASDVRNITTENGSQPPGPVSHNELRRTTPTPDPIRTNNVRNTETLSTSQLQERQLTANQEYVLPDDRAVDMTQCCNENSALLETGLQQKVRRTSGCKYGSPRHSQSFTTSSLGSPGSSYSVDLDVVNTSRDSDSASNGHSVLSPLQSLVGSPQNSSNIEICKRPAQKRTPVKCTRCKNPFTSKRILAQHMKACLDVQVTSVPCPICQLVLPNRKRWSDHMKTHETWHKCPQCDAAYKQKSCLEKHIAELHKDSREPVNTPPCGPELLKLLGRKVR